MSVGFVLDDYFLLDQVEAPDGPLELNLYRSFESSVPMPWWTEPEWRISFWRPLSGALVWLDHALFGRWGAGYHIHSLLWMLVFLAGAAVRVPALAAGALAGFPAGLWAIESVRPWQIAVGAASLMAVAAWARGVWGELEEALRRDLRWWVPGAVGAMLPAAVAAPSERQLLIPMLGFAVLLAAVLSFAWSRWRRQRRRLAGTALAVLGLMHFAVAPLTRPMTLFGFRDLGQGLGEVVERLSTAIPAGDAGKHLVAVNAPNLFTGFYVPAMRRFHGDPNPMAWSVLSAAPHAHRLTRTDSRTLELQVVGGQMLATPMEQTIRSPKNPLRVGEVVESELFRARVLETGELGPTRVALRFDRPLEEVEAVLLVWSGELRVQAPPAVGATLELPASRGPETRL